MDRFRTLSLVALIVAPLASQHAFAWDSMGHRVVARIADHYLVPAVREKVHAMLSADSDALAAHDIESAATWADKYKANDKEVMPDGYGRTDRWHFADIDAGTPDLNAACFGREPLAAGTPASRGPPKACIIDKIDQFAAELRDPKVSAAERLLALKFLLNLVGDVHQPLNVAVEEGNHHGINQPVEAVNTTPGDLYSYWDSAFVHALGFDEVSVADQLIAKISPADRKQWSAGTPEKWALEAHELGVSRGYGVLSQGNDHGVPILADNYVKKATETVGTQLSKAGVRLAAMLNRALRAT